MGGEGTGDAAKAESLEGLPREGDVVGGKFRVEGMLGAGGMGVVLAARHVQLGQKVAIKVLRRRFADSPEAVGRFLREARTAVNLQSANVVRVMDVGTLDDGIPYMVMEHLTGRDLGDLLEARKALPVDEAVGYVLQGMEAVAEAHALGLVHRDLKPANLFLTARLDGSSLVKVLDFGISKATEPGADGASDPSLTATSAVMGSPMYMSPEQLRSSKNVDLRTDIWALGVVLYELVSGRYPFEDETVTGLCARIAADPPVPLHEHRPDVPPAFEAVVMRCLSKAAKDRPQTVAELASALRAFASPEAQLAVDRIGRIAAPSRSSPAVVSSRGAVSSPTGFADTVGATSQAAGARKGPLTPAVLVLGGVLAAAAVGGGLLLALRTAPPKAATPDPTASQGTAAVTVAPPPAASSLPAASAASTPPSAPPPAATAPAVSAPPTTPPTAKPVLPVIATAARPATRPTTSKPPSSDDLLLDRK
jgi:serine/threonine-protein kinase